MKWLVLLILSTTSCSSNNLELSRCINETASMTEKVPNSKKDWLKIKIACVKAGYETNKALEILRILK